MKRTRDSKTVLTVFSWVFLAAAFMALVVYLCVHVKDRLDSDMASEMVLAKQLFQNGKIISANWYYSTEIRVVNTQMVYALFFNVFQDWQLVRIFGNILLYLALLGSYYFLCRRLRIERYFPLTAGLLLLPLSGNYFYILWYGAYYIPRISMMFLILGMLIPASETSMNSAKKIALFAVPAILSFLLGLEGARMILILFIPLAILVCAEAVSRLLTRGKQGKMLLSDWISELSRFDFANLFLQSALACVAALAGYLINATNLSKTFSFDQVALEFRFSIVKVIRTIENQFQTIGSTLVTYALSVAIWVFVAILCFSYLLSKSKKPLTSVRFIGFCVIAWVCYSVCSCALSIELVAWHLVPIAILSVPAIVMILKDSNIKLVLRHSLGAGICACLLIVGIQGYASFDHWPDREGERCNDEFVKIAAVLEQEHLNGGYATFWNSNILTELTDGKVDVWSVNGFDAKTTVQPDVFHWLQVMSHGTELPAGNVFVLWTTQEYQKYNRLHFDYFGKEIYRSDAYVVFEVEQ